MVWAFYKEQTPEYSLKSVEKDNRGWDLEATKKGKTLYLEVKGHLGNVIQFELTPNEYARMQEHSKIYRVCVVFTPQMNNEFWFLVSDIGTQIVRLSEKTAAKASEVEDFD